MNTQRRAIRVGLLGCGNVGSAFVGLVRDQAKEIEARTGIDLQVTRVAVRNLSRDRDVELPPVLHRLALHRQNNVVDAKPGLGRGAVGIDVTQHDAPLP